MANEEHLAKLKEGVDAWNEWRKTDPGVQIDLSHAELRGANLNGFNLRGARLEGAKLCGATLFFAD
ncbi:MAG: pentapeptide repeat-containing protein [Acidobacteriota bacterium]